MTEDRSVRSALAGLPAGQRALVVSWGGLDLERSGRDRAVRTALRQVTRQAPDAIVLFRETRLGGTIADVGGIDRLADRVRLISGHLPRVCSPTGCEALRVAGPDVGEIPGLRVTGTARMLEADALAPFVASGETPHGAERVTVLTPDLDGLAAREEWQGIYRTFGWRVPVSRLHVWAIDGLGRTTDDLAAALGTADPGYVVSSPARALEPARALAHAAGRRLLLLGGTGLAVLLGFALLAGTRLRASIGRESERLGWAGASGPTRGGLAIAEVGLVTALSVVPGYALGAGAVAVVATAAGEPVGAIMTRTALSATGVGLAAGAAVGAGIAVLAVVLWRPTAGRRSWSGLIQVAVALALLAAVLLRGDLAAADTSSPGGAVTLLALPLLVAATTALTAGYGLIPLLRLLHRAPGAAAPLRVAMLYLARRPGAAASTSAYVAVAVGLAIFVAAYRDTLRRAAHDQAAFVTGADAVLAEAGLGAAIGRSPLPPSADPVVRLAGTLPDRSFVTILGLPARSIGDLAGWRADFASSSARDLGTAITPSTPRALAGAIVPSTATAISVDAATTGAPIVLEASIATTAGDVVAVPLGQLVPGRDPPRSASSACRPRRHALLDRLRAHRGPGARLGPSRYGRRGRNGPRHLRRGDPPARRDDRR